jgi:glycosyltransferase involved in cell wall biosynthesis
MDRQTPATETVPDAAPRVAVEQRPASGSPPVELAPDRVALAHDWLTGFRGGEWILEALCELFPKSPLYTLIHVPGSTSSVIEDRPIHTSFLNGWPGVAGGYRKLLPLFPTAVSRMKVPPEVETLVSTSHCVIKGLRKPGCAYHLSYIHSPMRYMYDQFDAYFGAGSGASFAVRQAALALRPYLVGWDKASNENVDLLVANSSFVRERIRKYYGRDAVVVHPFVELRDFGAAGLGATDAAPAEGTNQTVRADYFLMVTAFAPNKRVDLAIQAFNELRLPLKIIGGGQDETRLRSMAGPTIEFLGHVSRAGVVEHFRRARGFIFPGVEDFGITPLESLAAGTPIVAYQAGGVLETLRAEDTEFFDEPTAKSLVTGVRRFLERERKGDFAIDASRLAEFSRVAFQRRILDLIESRTRL